MRCIKREKQKQDTKDFQKNVALNITQALDSQFANLGVEPQPVEIAEGANQIEYRFGEKLMVVAVKVMKGKRMEIMVLTPEVTA